MRKRSGRYVNHLIAETAMWQECSDFLHRNPYSILPLGATEQHGPHLPQNTDTILAQALAENVAKQSVGLVLPPLAIGYSWVWRDYPGSLSFSLDTFRAVISDIARSVDRWGCRSLLIITAHGANVQPLKYIVRELVDELELKIVRVFYPGLHEILKDASSTMWLPMNFHADEFETSVMMHLRPNLVRMDRAVCEYPPRSVEYEMGALPMGSLSKSGVFGDPTVATAEKGERWFQLCVDQIVSVWTQAIALQSGKASIRGRK